MFSNKVATFKSWWPFYGPHTMNLLFMPSKRRETRTACLCDRHITHNIYMHKQMLEREILNGGRNMEAST